MEHPNLHLPIFLEVCNTLKLNGISTDAIHLCLFSFSLKDKARARLHSLPLDSITTWDELTRAFLAKFFPPSKTPSLRNQITTFTQGLIVVVLSSWTPKVDDHPNLLQWGHLICAAGGTLMNKTKEEAYNLIEKMTLNNFQWSSE